MPNTYFKTTHISSFTSEDYLHPKPKLQLLLEY